MLTSTLTVALLSTLALAAPAVDVKQHKHHKKANKYPFNRVVAFGDNLSDNGNGSYAWCIADPGHCTNSIYGARTWTDGPVAVSYLVDMLNLPLTYDFAIGHKAGGSKFGSTIDNNYTNSTAGVPSAYQQIANYTGNKQWSTGIGKTLHFLWTGANDLNLYHINPSSTNNSKFASQYSTLLVGAVQDLLDSGAEYVFVPGLYAKNISPSIQFYTSSTSGRANFGAAIQQANAQIQQKLAPFGKNVLYYDVYDRMMEIWNNAADYNITHTTDGAFCDGFSQADWDSCVTKKQGYLFYWMQYLDMTTYVHKYIAQDMFATIKAHKWS